MALVEVSLTARLSAYGGGRLYSGRNRLRDNAAGVELRGEREGNIAPLFGARVRPFPA